MFIDLPQNFRRQKLFLWLNITELFAFAEPFSLVVAPVLDFSVKSSWIEKKIWELWLGWLHYRLSRKINVVGWLLVKFIFRRLLAAPVITWVILGFRILWLVLLHYVTLRVDHDFFLVVLSLIVWFILFEARWFTCGKVRLTFGFFGRLHLTRLFNNN